jgi:hypothetical protein
MRRFSQPGVTGFSLVLICGTGAAADQPSGPLVGWGDQVVGGNLSGGFVALAGGGQHSLGLKADGSIVAWGDNTYGQCNVPIPNAGFRGRCGGQRPQSGSQD